MPILASFMVPHPPMIVPAVGRGSEKQIQKTIDAYIQVSKEIALLHPDTIIVSSPHATMYRDYFHISPGSCASGSFEQFRASSVAFKEQYDTELVDDIENLAAKSSFPAGTEGERDPKLDHGTMVPLWFIRQFCSDFKIVRIGLSGLPLTEHYKLGQIIRNTVQLSGKRVVLSPAEICLISFSHMAHTDMLRKGLCMTSESWMCAAALHLANSLSSVRPSAIKQRSADIVPSSLWPEYGMASQ